MRPCRVEIVVPAVAGAIIILSVLRALAPDYVLVGVSDDELMDELTRLYLYGLKSNQEEGAD